MSTVLITQIMRFGAVGVVGFCVDGGILWAFLAQGVDPYLARALSFPAAVVATWLLNRSWTFGDTKETLRKGDFQRYLGVQLVGTLSNYIVYSIIIGVFGAASAIVFGAFCAGSAVGAILNFCGARYVVFRA